MLWAARSILRISWFQLSIQQQAEGRESCSASWKYWRGTYGVRVNIRHFRRIGVENQSSAEYLTNDDQGRRGVFPLIGQKKGQRSESCSGDNDIMISGTPDHDDQG